MSLESAIAALRLEMATLGLSSLTVEASLGDTPAARRVRARGRWCLSGTEENVGDIIIRIMSHGNPMTMSHIHEAVADELPTIPADGTVRTIVWSMQQAGLVVKGERKAPSTSGRRSMTYRITQRD